jgi:hypothetical protein
VICNATSCLESFKDKNKFFYFQKRPSLLRRYELPSAS